MVSLSIFALSPRVDAFKDRIEADLSPLSFL